MIEMYKISSGKYDTAATPRVTREQSYITRGSDLRLEKRQKYDLHKYFYTNRVVNISNSLPKIDIVLCDTVNKFKSYLDKYWQYEYIVYDYKAEIHGTGSRSLYTLLEPVRISVFR